jgi:hypothetical protein
LNSNHDTSITGDFNINQFGNNTTKTDNLLIIYHDRNIQQHYLYTIKHYLYTIKHYPYTIKHYLSTDSLKLPGYKPPYRRDRVDRLGGGVVVFVKDEINCVTRLDLQVGSVGCIWLEIKN